MTDTQYVYPPSARQVAPPSAAKLAQRFVLHDLATGLDHPLDRPLPPLAQDGALPNGKTAATNIDPANSNFLRGGIGNMDANFRNRRNGYDNGDPDMPPRGARGPLSPAALWAYSVGTDGNNDINAVTPQSLCDFVRAALHRFDGPDQQEAINGLAEILDFHLDGAAPAEEDANGNGMNGDRNGNAGSFSRTDELARTPAGLGGNGARDQRRRAAQDAALARYDRGSFGQRFPEALPITVMG